MNAVCGPKLEAFDPNRSCPACSHHGPLLRRILGEARNAHTRLHLCRGGKEPTETCAHLTPMGAVQHELHYACAGIAEPHLHVTCMACGHMRLTQLFSEVAIYG